MALSATQSIANSLTERDRRTTSRGSSVPISAIRWRSLAAPSSPSWSSRRPGPHLAPYDPRAIDLRARFVPPGQAHWFGTDAAGSDVLSRVIYGSRLVLMSGVVVLVVSALGGSLLGLFAGFRGGGSTN